MEATHTPDWVADQQPLRLLCVEHESDAGPAMLAARARELGVIVDIVTPDSGIPTEVGAYDGVVVMGAVPSVNDAEIAWWFDRELALLRDADLNLVPVLGVCFGAQALAVALGGSVVQAPEPEIGWTVVNSIDPRIEPGPWLNWHVDAINPPPGARVLATSPVSVQAYEIGPHLAVQFHPEVTPVELDEWATTDGLTTAAAGADVPAILRQARAELPAARARANALMDHFLRTCRDARRLPREPARAGAARA